MKKKTKNMLWLVGLGGVAWLLFKGGKTQAKSEIVKASTEAAAKEAAVSGYFTF